MLDKNMSIVNVGNKRYMSNLFDMVERENKINIVYLGGSITMGCHATKDEYRYVNRSAKWWTNTFPTADVQFFNAGIGATTSQFGTARVCDHVLSKNPDLVFVEFSVNDDNTAEYMETYESLVRRILSYDTVKAVVLISNCFYDSGINAQGAHANIGLHYGLPMISVRNYLYPEIQLGTIDLAKYTSDMLHPTDMGHKMISDLVMNLLDVEYDYYKKSADVGEKPKLAKKFTLCRYEDAQRFQNKNSQPKLNGFVADTHVEQQFSNPFKDGWIGAHEGDSIEFDVDGGIILIQWRRTINKPAPIAYAIVDGNDDEKILLDANFDEDWGDLCCLTKILDSENKGKHTVKIVIDKEGKQGSDFMLISLICSNYK